MNNTKRCKHPLKRGESSSKIRTDISYLEMNLFSNPRKIRQYCILLSPIVDKPNRAYLRLAISQYAKYFDHVVKHRGRNTAFAQAKSVQNELKRLSLGLPPSYKYAFWTRTDKLGFPVKLGSLKRFILSSTPVLKGIGLTISNYYRCFEIDPVEDLSSIESQFTGLSPKVSCEFRLYLAEFASKLSFRKREDLPEIFPRYHLYPPLFTRGVSGGVNIATAHLDAAVVLRPENEEVLNALSVLFSRWNASFILNEARSLVNSDVEKDSAKLPLGKLVFIPDKGGKSRSVTMGNYYVQSALRPLHDELMQALKSNDNDFTFRTEQVSDYIQLMYSKGYRAYCFDMSSATDRFPKAFQQDVLSEIYGDEVAAAWSTLMGIPLAFRNKTVRFAVGQPMGLLSSFPAFALSHHFLVQACFNRFGLTATYMIIGDDVVIFLRLDTLRELPHSNPCSMYVNELKVLGVEIAMHKSIESSESMFVAEFTKRVFWNHHEITPIGAGLLQEPKFSVARAASIVLHLVNTWGETSKERLKQTALTLFRNLSPRKYRDAYIFKFLRKFKDVSTPLLIETIEEELNIINIDYEGINLLHSMYSLKHLYEGVKLHDFELLKVRLQTIYSQKRLKFAHPLLQLAGLEFNKYQELIDHYYYSVKNERMEVGSSVEIASAADQLIELRVQFFICKAYLSFIESRGKGFIPVYSEKPFVDLQTLRWLQNIDKSDSKLFLPETVRPATPRLRRFDSIAKIIMDIRGSVSRPFE